MISASRASVTCRVASSRASDWEKARHGSRGEKRSTQLCRKRYRQSGTGMRYAATSPHVSRPLSSRRHLGFARSTAQRTTAWMKPAKPSILRGAGPAPPAPPPPALASDASTGAGAAAASPSGSLAAPSGVKSSVTSKRPKAT